MIKPVAWDDGLFRSNRLFPRAALDRLPSYFEEILGTKFHEGLDDLDYYKGIILAIDRSTIAALVSYRENRYTGLHLPYDRPQPEFISEVIRQVLQRFDLAPRNVIWRDEPRR
jgi:hypothetical protein